MGKGQKFLDNVGEAVRKLNPHVFGETTKKRVNKYRAERTSYGGVMYDSKWEAEFAGGLDLLMRAGEIRGWARQVDFVLEGGVVARVDFIIFHHDGSYRVVDTKGVMTQESKNKYKQVKDRHGVEVEVIRKGEK